MNRCCRRRDAKKFERSQDDTVWNCNRTNRTADLIVPTFAVGLVDPSSCTRSTHQDVPVDDDAALRTRSSTCALVTSMSVFKADKAGSWESIYKPSVVAHLLE